MKNVFYSLLIFFLFSCGMSPEEKQDLSVVTCNIISEKEKFDVATKIKEINLAREKMGEDLFLGSGSEINNSFKYDLCVELVLNDDEYELKLQNAIEREKEKERLARIQREEEERLARIQREEEKRLARIQREEEERLARIQREEEERQLAENLAAYSSSINNILKNYQPEPTLKYVNMGYTPISGYDLNLLIDCKNLQGLSFNIIVTFKDNIGILKSETDSCGRYNSARIQITPRHNDNTKWTDRMFDIARYERETDSIEFIDTIILRLSDRPISGYDFTGRHISNGPEAREIIRLANPSTYNLNYSNAKIDYVDIKQNYTLYDSKTDS